ncbi:MAG: serine hydrolase [Patescibacteria group bacterium]
MSNNKKTKFVLALALAGWLFAGYFFFAGPTVPVEKEADAVAQYPYINKAITADIGKHFIINFKPLKDKFLEIQKRYTGKTYVYFVYLNNASWVGLGEKEMFYAASTVKVPMAMSLLRAVEEKKLSMADKYTLQDFDMNKDFGELYKDGADTEISAGQLQTLMLEKSDNTATLAIAHILTGIGMTDPLINVYKFMGWEYNSLGENPNYLNINLKTLANMFVALYDAQYVNVGDSNDILNHLSNSSFDDKIVAGVPRNVKVAHKEGNGGSYKAYSDCGIVYASSRHYILCVAVDGGTESVANDFISEISRATYGFVMNN